ncbi:MAG TPA: asparagine synthase (glutamine-hydrolyzing) [Candidatus Limnocylindrales bacterium]|nr:asparagine synthase (glutamine-hydrolyzing) [Candidatus Limnocylindrales bacterium]
MCGLAAVALLDGVELSHSTVDPLLEAMTRAVAHRGPDNQVTVRCGCVGFGFARLALVAPEAGDQPLRTPDGQIALIANGEVYNHRELERGLPRGRRMQTGSDCEVLAHLYQLRGREFLADVRGMFAIILHDATRNRLVLARDRFGIKPLYFHRNAKRIVVASEIKGLFADSDTPREIDWTGALSSQALQSRPALCDAMPITWFRGIETVEPGTVVEIDLEDGRESVYRYWEFPGQRPMLGATDEDVTEEYLRLLTESVTECATADAELGLFLSGGVDSAAVAALAASQRTLDTFTILSPATVVSGDAYFADLVARQFGLPNHQVYVPADHCPTVHDWLRFVWLMENPMVGAEAYLKHELHRYARAASPGLKGMLLGAASDEFNAGYSTDLAGGGGWGQFTANLAAMAQRGDRDDPAASAWMDAVGAAVLRGPHRPKTDVYLRYLNSEYRKIYQYNVWHEDRSAAGSGIEARVPFLDHRLVELVAAIPPRRREGLLWDKRILRNAVAGLLPAAVAERPKVPFVHGEGVQHTQQMLLRLLVRDGCDLVRLAMSTAGAREHLDTDAIERLVDGFRHGIGVDRVDFVVRLVNLGVLEHELSHLPPPIVDRPVPRLLERWSGPELRLESGRAAADVVLRRPKFSSDTVIDWARDVLVLDAPDGSRFILRDGSIEYIVEAEAAAWHAMCGLIDGKKSLQDVLTATASEYPDVELELLEAMDAGLIELAAGSTMDPGQ